MGLYRLTYSVRSATGRAGTIFFIFMLVCFSPVAAGKRYFLCGPDEDGCQADDYQYCVCMPYDEGTANSPYCLDFSDVSCVPLTERPDCGSIFKNQSDCVAAAFQSETTPPCPVHSESFCLKHHVPLCQADASVSTCR